MENSQVFDDKPQKSIGDKVAIVAIVFIILAITASLIYQFGFKEETFDINKHVCDSWTVEYVEEPFQKEDNHFDCQFKQGWYYEVCKYCMSWHTLSEECPACVNSTWTESCAQACECELWAQKPCLSEINIYIPVGYEADIDYAPDPKYVCYDYESDPDDLKGMVADMIQKYPTDWQSRIEPHPLDPVVNFIKTEEVTEPIVEELMNNMKEDKDLCLFVRSK